ncbi:MAG: amidohydrolase [Methanospirillum sp.]|uniref:amidohydrolase n=1 Tax=Methanospirillum sp. TaxID=45200 RepID=UPI002370679C|nr:amidohydrolase [Methanospirillum sp.]MDD1727841.1 amidohydrolase [Methanospirillum sp.]
MMTEEFSSETPCMAFSGGRILTMNRSEPEVQAIVFQNGKILATGQRDILQRYDEITIIDLKGKTLIPGFIDSHIHLSFGAFLPEWADLSGCSSKEEVLSKMRIHADTHPETEWIVGFPWFDLPYGGYDITREELDAAVSAKPAILIHTSFHALLANTLACKKGGISRESQDPDSGFIEKREDGEVSGVLLEAACVPVLSHVLSISPRRYAELINQAARDLHRFGITAIQDPGVTPDAEAAYRLLHAEQRLPVSVLMMPHGKTLLDNRIGDRLDGEPCGSGDEQLRVGPVKVFGDGATQKTTAFTFQIADQTVSSGEYRNDFQETLREAVGHGFQVCVHCLGNRTVDAVLDAFESSKNEVPSGFILRPRLEHLNLLSPEQISRLSSMHCCASIQPQFLSRAGNMNRMPINGATWFAYRDLITHGVILGGSSDYPGGFMDGRDVIACIRMGSTMSDGNGNTISPDQIMPFEEWLWIYTAGSAYVGNQEHERGMLAEGMVADFVILDGLLDPLSPPVVSETWIGGKRVYCRNDEEQDR